jgi:hypothetical protein
MKIKGELKNVIGEIFRANTLGRLAIQKHNKLDGAEQNITCSTFHIISLFTKILVERTSLGNHPWKECI